MTKICHMTSAHAPEDVRIFHKECSSLAKAGYDVYLVERGDSYEKNGVHMVGIGEVTGGRLARMTRVARQVYRAALDELAQPFYPSEELLNQDKRMLAGFIVGSLEKFEEYLKQPSKQEREYTHSFLNELAPLARKFRKIIE